MEIKTLAHDQSNYPITSQAWFREIDYIGNIELINHPMTAIFSSAKCPASLILKAHDYAKEISLKTFPANLPDLAIWQSVDFIVNYDVKYRMGAELEEEE